MPLYTGARLASVQETREGSDQNSELVTNNETQKTQTPWRPPSSGRSSKVWGRGQTLGSNATRTGSQYNPATARSPSTYNATGRRASGAYSAATPKAPKAYRNTSMAMDGLASKMDGIHLSSQKANQPNQHVANPSMAPNLLNVSDNWRQRGKAFSQASGRSVRQPVMNAVCRMLNRTRRDFSKGDILTVPFHVANMNPNISPNDPHFTQTMVGPAYSKRRVLVVTRIFLNHMDCLPFYTNGGRSLSHKSAHEKEEWVTVMNVGEDDTFVNEGLYPPVAVEMRAGPMDPKTTIHITASVKVGCAEDVARIGAMDKKSFDKLMGLRLNLDQKAEAEPWRS